MIFSNASFIEQKRVSNSEFSILEFQITKDSEIWRL